MLNKTITIVIILIIILSLIGFFFFKRSKSNLSQELNLPQPLISPISLMSEPTSQLEPINQTGVTTQTETIIPTGTIIQTTTEELSLPIQAESQNIIIFSDSGYSPNTLYIKVGTNVVFKNQSSKAMWPASDFHPTHSLYSGTTLSEHCPDTQGIAFDACTGIQPGDSWNFTFNKKGKWKYHDHLNPAYTGIIIVE